MRPKTCVRGALLDGGGKTEAKNKKKQPQMTISSPDTQKIDARPTNEASRASKSHNDSCF